MEQRVSVGGLALCVPARVSVCVRCATVCEPWRAGVLERGVIGRRNEHTTQVNSRSGAIHSLPSIVSHFAFAATIRERTHTSDDNLQVMHCLLSRIPGARAREIDSLHIE